ncbi:acyl-ACP--UDP-N-acetylglucosamine O-acyltransferase [Fluviispira multicolorata]|uniref:Acyl-[acyl-carrier-protein]--UDP-N-acetylglucosamine O-acyltransferase n=1 Tax=Fluviispira multicolorata TaxID=2654512 RepID=A0A833JAW2_9BACT|nr:acyl-ACP--UDP-N-acetylglucosamine O-acyltransferase [Fluviispira multicolorata]KAB8028463.1 acyl-ACP--UDP-N-acetylglucosamine O-acyltransferase [Fluviispira multicolorata]
MNSSSTQIHPTAIIEDGAELDSGVIIGPYATIGKNVKIGKGTEVHGHALVTGHTTIGEYNTIFSYASVGNIPQDLKYKGEPTQLIVGNKNIIREFTTLQTGTIQGGGKTEIGDENLFMNYVHVAHDCLIGNQNIFANVVQLAGHVTIHNKVTIGGICAVHQYVHIGDMAMLAAGSVTVKDVPPYCMAEGGRAILRGLNMEGLRRRNVSSEARNALKAAYKVFFYHGHPTIEESIASLSELIHFQEVKKFADFIRNSKRGVAHPQNIHREPSFEG